ncbi:MAG: hypothetical protein HYT13_01070 [Candidatus Liptonbacteria bacterium]|nr:hypothetical protein [Candidatus Liptonbacteria bacterium]
MVVPLELPPKPEDYRPTHGARDFSFSVLSYEAKGIKMLVTTSVIKAYFPSFI